MGGLRVFGIVGDERCGGEEGEGFFIGKTEIERKIFCHEGVECCAFGGAIVVAFIGKVCVLCRIGFAEKAVDFFQMRELELRHLCGPVLAIGDEQQRLRGDDGGDFQIVGDVMWSHVNGKAAFAGATAIEPR